MVPKVIVPVNMVFSIDGDDLKELPEETKQEAMVSLRNVGLKQYQPDIPTVQGMNISQYCTKVM